MLIQGANAYIGFNLSNKTGRIGLSGAAVSIIFKRNEWETPITKDCTITDAINGIASVMLLPTDLSEPGNYYYQIKIVFSDSSIMKSEIASFYVEESLV